MTTCGSSASILCPTNWTGHERSGAHEALTPDEATAQGVKASVVIEAAGNGPALETAIGLTAPGGRTITVGLPRPETRISVSPLGGFVAEGRSLIGSYLGSSVPSRDIPRFVELWRAGRLPSRSWSPRGSRSMTSTPGWSSWRTVERSAMSSSSAESR